VDTQALVGTAGILPPGILESVDIVVIQVFPDILVQGHQDILATVAFLDILGYRVILVIQDSVDTQAQADIQVQADILERAVISAVKQLIKNVGVITNDA
jgi:hypothetical protein